MIIIKKDLDIKTNNNHVNDQDTKYPFKSLQYIHTLC